MYMVCLLPSVVHEVPAITVNFWEVVAESLGTGHSARECSSQYLSTTSKQTRKQQQTTATARVTQSSGTGGKRVVITGRCGTLKRKKQLRNALEHMDDGYSDDIFDSTPFKNTMKTVKVRAVQCHVMSVHMHTCTVSMYMYVYTCIICMTLLHAAT